MRAILRVGSVAVGFAMGSVGLAGTVAPTLQQRLAGGGSGGMLVLLDESNELEPADGSSPADLYAMLPGRAQRSQAALRAWLQREQIPFDSYWLVNAVRVHGSLALAQRLAARADVREVVDDAPHDGTLPVTGRPSTFAAAPDAGPEWGVTMVGAPSVWSTFTRRGEGLVIAIPDTGVEWTHPALKPHYRGWNPVEGRADHRYSWHDAIGTSAVPLDGQDHGTHVTGIAIGDDGAGNQIGVAPGAQWVACRAIKPDGSGTPSSYLECLEWALAPYPQGGNKLTEGRPDLAPHLLNTSWGCTETGCDLNVLKDAFVRLKRAGVLVVSASGNGISNCSTIRYSPPVHDEVFTVGAIDTDKKIKYFSSRGPVTVDGSNRLKPNLTAPGGFVRSSIPGGGYVEKQGTSQAAPHAAGSAALVWSVRPAWIGKVDLTRCLLERSAAPAAGDTQVCGGIPGNQYPNYIFGYGIVNAYAALTLSDGDADLVGDPCDCAPADGGAYDRPGEVRGLSFRVGSQTQLVWISQAATAGSAVGYDLLSGDLATLRAQGNISAATCLARNVGAAAYDDPRTPSSGAAFYYLVRARNVCDVAGWGAASSGTARQNNACD